MALQSIAALGSVTLQNASSSVSFLNIPQNYRDLILIFSGTAVDGGAQLRLNNDDGNNYTYMSMQGSGAGAQSFAGSLNFAIGTMSSYSTNAGGMVIFTVFDSSATDKHKVIMARHDGNNATATTATINRWANTTAVTSVTCLNSGTLFNAGSTFDLYGRIA